jgi:hypothetical protein
LHWIRLVAFAVKAGAFVVGCYADDNPDLTGSGLDASAGPESGSGPEAGATMDSGAAPDGDARAAEDADAGDAGAEGAADAMAPPLFALVHAAPDVPGVRFCFGVTPTGGLAGAVAKPLVPGGLPFGAGGPLPVAAAQAAALAGANLYVWAIPASSIQSASDAGQDPSDCSVAPGLPGSMLFDEIPAGTFQFGHSYVIAMVGCQHPEVDGGAATCGSPATDGGTVAFPSGPVLGNLRLEIVSLDDATVVPQGAIGAQFLHLSPSLQALVPGGVVPGITSPADSGDGGDAAAMLDYADLTSTPVSFNGVYSGPPGSTLAMPAQAFVGTSAAAANLETAGLGLRTASLAVPFPALASIPLSTVALATLGSVDGGAPTASDLFVTGRSYTFVAVGNVGEAPGATTTFFRVIALPSLH